MPLQKVSSVKLETHDTKTIEFSLDRPLNFKPGQFIIIGLEKESGGLKKMIKRAYSISSKPTHNSHVGVTFRMYPQGQLSPLLFNLREGDTAEVTGPYGTFCVDESKGNDIVMVGAGTGISPFRSMILHNLEKRPQIKMRLLYSSKTEADMIFYRELLELEGKNANLKCEFTITRPHENKAQWAGKTGRINREMIEALVIGLDNPDFFVCGPPEMVKSSIEIIKGIGVDEDRIKKEQWE